MTDFLNSFSNREIAIAFWLVVIFVWFLFKVNNFKSFVSLIKVFFAKKLVFHYMVIIIYLILILNLLKKTVLWEDFFIKDFLLWCIGFGFYSFFTSTKIQCNKHLYNNFFKVFSITIFVDFFLNYFTFSLGWELIIIPILSFFAIIEIYTKMNLDKEGYKQLNKVSKFVLSIAGFGIFFYCIYQLFFEYEELLSNSSLKGFLLPVILSVLYFPLLAFYPALLKVDNIFMEVNRYKFIDSKRKWKIKIATIIFGNFNLDKLTRIRKWDKREIQSNDKIFDYIRKL